MALATRLKHFLLGRPIATKRAHHERLPKRFALPVFASDALSSNAYATEEIMLALKIFAPAGLGLAFLSHTVEFAVAISILIFIVAISYYQTIHAYPQGGGSYTVSKENLGEFPGKVAGAALLIDYILTVSVSISAGVLAIVSLVPTLQAHIVPLGLSAIFLMTMLNLRGTRESGVVFSVPAYGFILLMISMIGYGLTLAPAPVPVEMLEAQQRAAATGQPWYALVGVFLILKAFSSGCAALTGIEAISNGTTAFKEPVARNASTVLIVLAVLLSIIFCGISILAERFHVIPMEVSEPGFKTVVAQIATAVFGEGPLFGLIQVITAAILILAANTAYAGFPRLANLIAQDGFLPRQFASLGDRLVFQNGIIVLSIVAGMLIVGFGGDTHKLVPLYAIGVFMSFTLSQYGMVVFSKRKGKIVPMVISLVGGTVTLVITFVVAVSKWTSGAWLVPPALIVMLLFFDRVKNHYKKLGQALSVQPDDTLPKVRSTVLLLVPRMHKGILQAVAYARSMTTDVRALHVTLDPKGTGRIKEDWAKFGADIPLVILESPYRSLVEPITEYIDEAIEDSPDLLVTVIVPQAVPKKWWQGMLHSNAAVPLKLALAGRKNVVITNIRYFIT
ncbi:MAG: APC family permease [Fimbriimonadaceae bacterium]|nr:APC family permease [Fimbriimonadaceae bacterium]QYK58386.1 MAG: APC family permease [Fimbriimonadaceae bacterium]